MSDRLPPIPVPPAQLLRQLRLQYLPLVVFIVGVVAVFVIWTRWVAPPTFVAEAEAIRVEVRSTLAGTMSGMNVALLQPVKAGQTLGHVVITDPKVIEASLAVIRAEIDVIRTTMEPIVGQQRARLDFERLQLDWMSKRVELAALQVQLQLAESNLTRTASLFQGKMITEERFEEVKGLRDSLLAQVKAQGELIAQLEPGIRSFSAGGGMELPPPADGLRAAVKLQEENLRLTEAQLQPVPLRAPIDGVITMIHRRPGEVIGAAEPILQVSATRIERIVGFLRQPLPDVPQPGTPVQVRTRTFPRQVGRATVIEVGGQFEPIMPTLLGAMRLPVSSIPIEYGLRVHVAVPPGLALRPGEYVDVIVVD
ncbi:MAG: HlyD family efflux transporter periplasmic adaptor subunit [Opitutaceae bacterium]|nr:HlyD family efflux transporter periplasmic adaptor subunit [Opitutaceae bacterium]